MNPMVHGAILWPEAQDGRTATCQDVLTVITFGLNVFGLFFNLTIKYLSKKSQIQLALFSTLTRIECT